MPSKKTTGDTVPKVRATRTTTPKTTKKTRKTFEVDQTIYAKDDEQTQVQISETSVVKNDDDDGLMQPQNSSILHIPVPIMEITDSLKNQMECDLTGQHQTNIETPMPFDPGNYGAATLEEQEHMEVENPILNTQHVSAKKMESTTLYQFFGMVKVDEPVKKQAMPHNDVEPAELSVGTKVIDAVQDIHDGFLRPSGWERPQEKFEVVWKKSTFLGAAATPKSNQCNSVCHWCCHAFEHTAIGIPMKYRKGKFHIRGNYCSYACAASAILYDRSDWNYQPSESYSLLHLMYRKTHVRENLGPDFFIRSAPPRETLMMFGGPCTIEEFRQTTMNDEKRIECFNPPFVSLVSTVEEITYEKGNKKRVPFHSRFQHGELAGSSAQPGVSPIWLGQGLAGSSIRT